MAFAVFAIMSTMIVQILNIVSVQRRWNNDFSRDMFDQEGVLVTADKLGYVDGAENDGHLEFAFSDGSTVKADYQMKGTGDSGSVDGLAYFVTAESEKMSNDDDDDGNGSDPENSNNNTGAQTDRVDARITGTKGFDYIRIDNVFKADEYKDASGRTITVYVFELSAQASKYMYVGDIPYANYRLYFYDKSGKQAQIVSANYLSNSVSSANDWKNLGNESKIAISYSTGAVQTVPSGANNKYTVSITAANGIRIGSPFSKGSGGNNNNNNGGGDSPKVYKRCTECGGIFYEKWGNWCLEADENQWSYRQCPKSVSSGNGWYNCTDHLEPYTPPAKDPDPIPEEEDDTPWTGNGVKFTSGNKTRIEISFVGDPQLTINSFGSNGSNGVYTANATVGGIEVGPNIYGAFPKK